MSLQDRLAAVTRGASGHGVRDSPTEKVQSNLNVKKQEEDSIMKEIQIASEHHSLLEEMLTTSADQTGEESQDVRETLDVSSITQFEFARFVYTLLLKRLSALI